MSRRGRLFLLIGMLAAALHCTACDHEDDPAAGAEGEEPPPEFNYIPLNDPDKVCRDGAAAFAAVDTLLKASSSGFAHHMELCSDAARLESGCPACAAGENPLQDAIDGLLQSNARMLAGVDDLNGYFRDALAYPYRFGVLSMNCPEGSNALGFDCLDSSGSSVLSDSPEALSLVLTQAAEREQLECRPTELDANGFPTRKYRGGQRCMTVEAESLDVECEKFTFELGASVTKSGDRIEVSSQPTLSAEFGFVVPLVDDLSALEGMDNDREAQIWLDAQPKVAALLRFPSLNMTVDASTGRACARLEGYLDRCVLSQLVMGDLSQLDPYTEDPNGELFIGAPYQSACGEGSAEYIKTVLSLDVSPANFIPRGAELSQMAQGGAR